MGRKKYEIIPTRFILKQIEYLSDKTKNILRRKIEQIKTNPFRNKRLTAKDIILFRARFEDRRCEKRLVYQIEKNKVKLICILDRRNDYHDLEEYIRKR